MAFSLEAALVLPITLGLLVGTLNATQSLLRHQNEMAHAMAHLQVEQLSLADLKQILDNGFSIRTSPQIVIEGLELWREYRQLFKPSDAGQ